MSVRGSEVLGVRDPAKLVSNRQQGPNLSPSDESAVVLGFG
jgi:hypothetical protein